MDHFVFVINKRSGRQKSEELESRIQAAVKEHPISAECHITQDADHTAEIVHTALTRGRENFVAVGGDGTVNTLARHLVHRKAMLGIIPRGSGNGLARHLGMPANISEAIKQLIPRRTLAVDAILINDFWSFNVAGIGFDGYISTLFGQNGKRGMRNYIRLINQEYKSYQPIEMEIHSEGRIMHNQVFQLAIANASQYGNNAIIAPFAALDDQLLDISLISKVPYSFLPGFLLRVIAGKIHKSRYWNSFKTNRMYIKTSRPVHFHTDGDGRGISEHFNVELVPACLKLIY